MASVNWQKQTRQKAGAMQRHLNAKERMEVKHSNPDIDKSRCGENYYIGCNDYADAYKAMCRRVDEVDKECPPQRVRKDRAVCCSLYAPCPQEIFDSGRSQEFFNELHNVYRNFFGSENVHGGCVHLDEMHNYIEDGVEKMSLAHSTTLVSCYVEWKDKNGNERRGINGKNFETKARLNALNKAVCDMVRDKFGIEYNTGEKTKSGRSVEELKARQGLEKIKKENDDFVQSITPSTTKKVKGIFGEKEVAKTEDELQQDKQILAAQAVLQREQAVAQKEEQQTRMATKIAAAQRELSEKSKALDEGWKAFEVEKKSFEIEKKSFAKAVMIQARQLADKIMRSLGFKPNKGHDINSQINVNMKQQQERSVEWRQQ